MKYIKAEVVLPEALLKEIQKYIHGELLYIPNPKGTRKKWGECSGSRLNLKQRNDAIRHSYSTGCSMEQLCEKFCLSFDTIKKIVYSAK